MTTKSYVDALAQGMNWVMPVMDKSQPIVTEVVVKHLGGYEYECIAKTSNMGEFPVEVPTPAVNIGQSLYTWAYELSDAEILAGAQVFFDIWAWHDSSEYYRELMDIFARIAKAKLSRDPNPHKTGDARYDPNEEAVYCYDGMRWVKMGIPA
jgi:hypothetical protein